MIWVFTPRKPKRVANCAALDPWNEGKKTDFSLDKCFDGGIVPAYAAMDEDSIPHRFALRSREEKQHRALPDSLAALWLKDHIKAEQLPALLHQLEPKL